VLGWRQRFDAPPQAFNFVGTGTVDGLTVLPADPSVFGTSVTRDERNIEAYARDQWLLTPDATLWLGLRHTRLERRSNTAPGTDQSFTTPWLAASLQLDPHTLVYASAGQGIEAAVAREHAPHQALHLRSPAHIRLDAGQTRRASADARL